MTSPTIETNASEKLVEVSVNNKPVSVPPETTGAEILRLAGVAADFELFRVVGKKEERVLPNETIKVHPHERFIASPTLEPS